MLKSMFVLSSKTYWAKFKLMIYRVYLFILSASLFLISTGCFSASENKTSPAESANIQNSNIANADETAEAGKKAAETTTRKSPPNECFGLKKEGFMLDKKQTFPLDFPPFEKSCFAVFHDPEFTDPALGAQFFVYRDGKEIFEFPEQFNGGNATCWVDAVAFDDVNKDDLKDILVVGKCGAKSGSYNENMAYINTGRDFKVNKEANMEMMDFSKISQMKDFIEKHQGSFAK